MTTLILLLVGLAAANDPIEIKPTASSEHRLTATWLTDFPIDAEGNDYGSESLYTHRWRAGAVVGNPKVQLIHEWDLFTGQFLGQTWAVPGEADARRRHLTGLTAPGAFKPRKASVLANVPGAQIEAGLVTSHWGLGMLANNGEQDPWFGVSEFGDRIIRMRITTRPAADSPLSITAAYDRVVEDDMARWSDGQWVDQGVVALLYRDDLGRTLGVYGVGRHQQELEAQRDTKVGVLDVYGALPVRLGADQVLTLSAEMAGVRGKTNRATTYASPDSIAIRSAGATGLVSYRHEAHRIGAHLAAGWASGDGDPDDEVSHDFTFDRDFGVGMVLFDEYLGAIDAAAHHTLIDPQYSGRPPDGIDATVTEGAFRRATFLQPILEADPMAWLKIRVGGAISWATGPIGQRFYTYRAGGTPTNHHNQATAGYHLGSEVDWALDLGGNSLEINGRSLRFPTLVVTGGHAWLGEALQGPGPDRLDMYRLMLRTRM